MEIKREFTFYDLIDECWGGAIPTLDTISEHDKQDEFMQLLQEIFEEIPDLTQVNDFIAFDDNYIFEMLGIEEEEEDEENE